MQLKCIAAKALISALLAAVIKPILWAYSVGVMQTYCKEQPQTHYLQVLQGMAFTCLIDEALEQNDHGF